MGEVLHKYSLGCRKGYGVSHFFFLLVFEIEFLRVAMAVVDQDGFKFRDLPASAS